MLTVWNAFNDLFRDEDLWLQRPQRAMTQREFLPAVDVIENDDAFVLRADVPGMKPENIDISVDKNVLTLTGERRLERKEEKEGYHRVERHYGNFKRSFVLPEGVKADQIEAGVADGILTISIPKSEVAAPRKIKVSASSGLADKAKKLFSKNETTTETHPS